MYRKIFTPNEQDNSIPLAIPREWYGQPVEVIVFPLVNTGDDLLPPQNAIVQNRRKEREKLLDKYLIDLSGFKFNRDEANNYD